MDSLKQELFKKMEEITCPFCRKNFIISFSSVLPYLNSVTTKEEISEAKEDLRNKIKNSSLIAEETKQELYQYINESPIEQSDVEPLLQQIIKEESEKHA